MTTVIPATVLHTNLSDILDRVQDQGEEFTVTRNGYPIAKLRPTTSRRQVTAHDLADQMRDLPIPDGGFDAGHRVISERQS